MIEIEFINDSNDNVKIYQKMAQNLINNGLEILKRQNDNFSLTIQFVTDIKALELNKKYRNKNYIPDVLSFPTTINEKEVTAIGSLELGDIIISLSEARRKALKYNHSLNTEVAFLLVHGFLHLLGFDHEKNQLAETEMFAWQDKILASINYKYEIKYQ